MDFWKAVVGLARMPRVFVPTLLLALALGLAAFVAVPTSFVSSTTMVLTTTEFGGTQSRDPDAPTELVNPMLTFNDSLRTSADMLIWSMASRDVKSELERDGRVELTVNDGRTNPELLSFNGPIVYVSAESDDPDLAENAVALASTMMREKLLQWQEEMAAPSTTYISMLDVVPPSNSDADYGRKLKLAMLAFAAGILLGMAVAYGWTRARAGRAAARPVEPDESVDAPRRLTAAAGRPSRPPSKTNRPVKKKAKSPVGAGYR